MSTLSRSSETPSSGNSLHAQFEALLPRLERHGQVYFRHVKCRSRQQDCIAEMIGLVWQWLVRLAEKGKDGFRFPMVLANFAARAVNSGRRVAGMERARDALSPVAQQWQRFFVESLPIAPRVPFENLYAQPHGQERQDAWEERLRDNTVTPIPVQVQFRIDFPAWLQTLTTRERRMVRAMAQNERTKDLSRHFELSPGRISQMRREFMEDWRRYCGDEVPA